MGTESGVTAARFRSCTLLIFIIFAAAGVLPSSLKASEKKSNWIEVRSPHFTVDSNSGKGQAKMVALRLELIRDVIARVFNRAEDARTAPLTILAVEDEPSLKRLLPGYFKRGRVHPVGLFTQLFTGDYIVLRTDVMEPGVFNPAFHEYTHFVMRQTLPDTPMWLVEGLADFYSNTQVEKHDVVIGLPDAEDLQELHSNTWQIPLRTLLAVDYSSPYYNRPDKVELFYAESWLLTHYLMLQDARHRTQHVSDYTQQVEKGGDPVETFVKIFGPLKSLDMKLAIYRQQLAFTGFRFPITVQDSSKTYTVLKLSQIEADDDQAEFLLLNGDRPEAEKLINKALQEDPQSSRANALMSLLLLQEGKKAEAVGSAQKAIQLDPSDYHGYFYQALAMQDRALNTVNSAQVEDDLEKAIRLRPGFSTAEMMLSDLYLTRGIKSQQSLALAADAASNEPEDNAVLTNLVAVLLKNGRLADAVRTEMQMLGRARTPQQEAMVRNDLGWHLMRRNIAMPRADHEIRVAAQLDPKNADILDSLGYLLKKEGDLPHAEDAFRRALASQPKLVSSLDGLGDVLSRQHDLDGAIAEYRKALTVNPEDAQAHYDLSVALKSKGDNAGAAAELKAAQHLDPYNSTYR